MTMSKHARTRLASQRPMPGKQTLEAKEEPSPEQQEEEPTLSELDTEIECPRCNEELVYFCDSCSFVLKCV